MSRQVDELEAQLPEKFFVHQREALELVVTDEPERLCFYYPTGKGKTLTSLAALHLMGVYSALVITPPSTYAAWMAQAKVLGMTIECVSHAKFRQRGYQLSRRKAVIADEFHLFGGHTGQGWKKLKRLSLVLEAPLILMSATPNYNDAERVYCIQSIIDAPGVAGGYLQFLYDNCTTEVNPFGVLPKVTGFRNYVSAEEYLADLNNVLYLPDELIYSINDVPVVAPVYPSFDQYGYDKRKHRIMASQMEARHTATYNSLVDEHGLLWPSVEAKLDTLCNVSASTLVYANHATVAQAAFVTLAKRWSSVSLVTGSTPAKQKELILDEFRRDRSAILVGTATLATGTDGLDKVCDTLVILDDTDDDALRRQLIGRIMPRGVGGIASRKQVFRIVPS